MKNNINTGLSFLKKAFLLAGMMLVLHKQQLMGQYISLNGAYVSVSAGTVVGADTVNNNGSTTLANNGVLTLNTLINAGTTQGDGTYNIAKTFSGSGTFAPGNSTVNYNGTGAQTVRALNYYNLTVSLNGTRTVTFDNSGSIGVADSLALASGTTSYVTTNSTVEYNGTGAQTITGFNYNNLTVSGGSTKTVGGSTSITGDLTLGANTTLALGSNDITLRSTSTANARIATVPSTADITYGTGKFVVQRYIMGRRKYRLTTSSVTTSPNSTLITGEEALSIWGNWQNQGDNTTANTGTIITGGSSTDGFDQQTTTASMYTYDDVNRKFVGYTTANGKNTKYTPLKAGIAYYLFVYGDRTNTITTTSPHNTTLSERGTVLKGDQTYTTSSTIPLSSVTNRFTMLGNPFASPIDWAAVSRTNVSNTFWGWDPNLNSTGGYVTVTSTGTVTLVSPFSGTVGLDQYIQPGQGFFVKTTGSSPSMTIHEADKVSNFNGIAFKGGSGTNLVNNIPLIAVNLQYNNAGTMTLLDGALAAYDPAFPNTVGNEDATKIGGSTEVVSIVNGTDSLSIDARQLPQNQDTMFLKLNRLTKPQYTLQIFSKQMETSPVNAYLEDLYLGTSTLLTFTDTNRIVFNVTPGVPASSATNRFRIVFRQGGILPVTFTAISARQKNADVQVDWTVAEEASTKKYQVEHSTNGINFSTAGEVAAKGSNGAQSYQWLDLSPASGNNFYRIRSIDADGSFLLSKVVLVKIDAAGISTADAGMKIFPNPVKDQQINIQLLNMEKGEYAVQLVSPQGQQVLQRTITHGGGNGNYLIRFSQKLPGGVYYIKLISKIISRSQAVYIE